MSDIERSRFDSFDVPTPGHMKYVFFKFESHLRIVNLGPLCMTDFDPAQAGRYAIATIECR
jgi:hypothetical protein